MNSTQPMPTRSDVVVTSPVIAHTRTGTDPTPLLVLGLGEPAPRVSWSIAEAPTDWQLQVAELEATSEDGTIALASVTTPPQTGLAWPFSPLSSRERRHLRVRVSGNDGSWSAWSPSVTIEAGLLEGTDWQATMVGPASDGPLAQIPVLLRHSFTVAERAVARVRLHASAHGVYQAELNGRRVGDDELAPGWTTYESRLAYQVHDIDPAQVHPGENVLGAWLADGWWRGHLGWGGGNAFYGTDLGLVAQLEITYADGSRDIVATSPGSWRAAAGPITASDLYDGETYDARLLPTGWSEPGFDDSAWEPTTAREFDAAVLVAASAPPVRVVDTLPVRSVSTAPSGETILDFGQNIAGRLRLRVQGQEGTRITLRHAEELADGELCTAPLRGARATDTLVLSAGGTGETGWAPRFTTHGFRYVGISGWPGELDPADVVAEVLSTDMCMVASFDTSDAELNRLHDNVVWSFRGNSVAVPTDCPQRDERLGWTGDLQVFAPTAEFLADTTTFYDSWLRDLAAEQALHSGTPSVVPAVTMGYSGPMAAWCDVATILPWSMYQSTGDLELLGSHLETMRTWVREAHAAAGESHVWDTGFQYGDWLDPTAPAGRPEAAATPAELVATAYLARSTRILADTLALLGRSAEAEETMRLVDSVRQAFAEQYVTGAGRLLSDSTTAYALAICFDLLDADQRRRAGERLNELVRSAGHTVATGFVGTPLLCDALTVTGHGQTAFRVLTNPVQPGWLAEVRAGATTIWERWDSLLPDGSLNPSGMTSFNHYAFGAVADWMHRTLAGLAPAAPGWARLHVEPLVPRAGLTHASASTLTPFGQASAGWQLDNDEVTISVTVPVGVRADVVLPSGAEHRDLPHGTHEFSEPFAVDAGPRRGYTLDTPLDAMADDDEAGALVMGVVVKHIPEAAEHLGGAASAGSTTPRQIAAIMPNPDLALADLETGLAALNAFAPLPDGLLDPVEPASDGLEEDARLLGGASFWGTGGAEGMPSMVLCDGPHGVRRQFDAADNLGLNPAEKATCFPTASALACSWDRDLVHEVGAALGVEAAERGVDVLLGPGINIRRSPLGGRGFEYLSEDPVVSGELGASYVEGVQSTGIGTAVKHFAVNSQETDRLQVSADLDTRTLREIYLPAFERVVTRARPTMVMSAYNAINSTFCSENRWLLTDLLRDEWGFEGAVVSDWGAVKDRAEALAAGLDLEMPSSGDAGTQAIVSAVRSGALDRSAVDLSIERLRRVAQRVGAETHHVVPAEERTDHHELARRAAAESLVLLRNEDSTLPLADTGRIAVIGALAHNPSVQGGGSSAVNTDRIDSLVDELHLALPGAELRYAEGYSLLARTPAAEPSDPAAERTTLVDEALETASWADVAVVVVGTPMTDLSEGFDRTDIDLPSEQRVLLDAVVGQAPRTVVVVQGGGVVLLGDWHDRADAVLECFAAGEGCGWAIAQVLSGAVNPSGHLTETIPLRLEDTPAYLGFPGQERHARHGEGIFVGYRHYSTVGRRVRHPFGHGLSYTTFAMSDLAVTFDEEGGARVEVRVTNTGSRGGAHVVQVYVAPLDAPVRRPVRELKAFTKVHLEPGESRLVRLSLGRRDFAYWDESRDGWWVAQGRYAIEVRPDVDTEGTSVVVEVEGDAEHPRAVSLDSGVGEWFAHPVVGPQIMAMLSSGMPEEDREQAEEASSQLSMIASMPMTQFLRFPMVPLSEQDLAPLVEASRRAERGE